MSPEPDRPPSPYDRRTTVIARTVTRLVVPIVAMTAIALLLQGHNLPGGGFIGAVLTAAALVLVYVVFGAQYLVDTVGAEGPRLVGAYRALFAFGLAVALVSGLAPMALGGEFLTQAVVFVHDLPLYGELEVATALGFDLGVYLTVVGALLVVVAEVGNE
ncbi:MAG: MnhB domain-containing protein [Haloferacaceae archaeon]